MVTYPPPVSCWTQKFKLNPDLLLTYPHACAVSWSYVAEAKAWPAAVFCHTSQVLVPPELSHKLESARAA
jgi:hypothetical protein